MILTWTHKLFLSILLVVLASATVFAQSSTSTNYGINEYFIGPGGELDLNSANYSARATLGDLGTGNISGTSYQLYGGFTTTDDPYIELVVPSQTVDLGVVDETTTGTGTATFSVRTYLAEGYNVYVGGTVPTSENGDTIDVMSTKGTSSQGTEQFGLNLWTNSATGDYGAYGALPTQVPDSNFSFGTVDDEYNDDGQFKYDTTDSLAGSAQSSGQTDYTISYLMNVSPITEAGFYEAAQSIIATSTY